MCLCRDVKKTYYILQALAKTAGGDVEKVNKARDFVLYAIVGIIIALLAKGIVTWVQNILKPAILEK